MRGYKCMECTLVHPLEHDVEYCLQVYDSQYSYHSDVCMMFDENQEPLGRYQDLFGQSKQVAKAPSSNSRFRRSSNGAPSIEGITPRTGSPLGNTYVTTRILLQRKSTWPAPNLSPMVRARTP